MRRISLTISLICALPAAADSLTATRLIRPASILQEEDILRTVESIPGAISGEVDVIGLEARVTLYPGRAIRPGDIGPPALIERNDLVTLVFRSGRLSIVTDGRALSRGASGDIVRAMNLSSRSTITGVVSPEGHVLVTR